MSSLILLPFFAGEAFSQESQGLTVTTDKESYAAGEPIQITGFAESKLGDFKLIIQVYNPINNLITIKELDVNDDGTFSGEIATSISGLWAKDGTYTIITSYYSTEKAITQFEYGGMVSAGVKDVAPEVSMNEDENEELSENIMLEDHKLGYELTGGKIIRIIPDFEMKSLIIEIETYSDGELRITLPKDVIDTDDPEGFFVLVDGMETNHEATEITDRAQWSFIIPFSHGSEEIEIIGTYVIPEFGTVAALVLIVAIGTIIMISAKNKQIFYPKI